MACQILVVVKKRETELKLPLLAKLVFGDLEGLQINP